MDKQTSMAQELDTVQAELALCQQSLARTQAELAAYQRSPVWRLYGFVRGPVSLLRRLITSPATIQQKTQRLGGWPVVRQLLLRQWRQFGTGGFARYALIRLFKPNSKPAPGSGTLHRDDYTAWFQRHGRSMAVGPVPSSGPLLSVVIPIYKPDLALFKEAIESVLAQSYPRWELCMADDASQDPALSAYLTALTAQHPNVHVVVREQNGHIAACTNSALTLATGEFVVLFDQDDLLPTHALQRVAETLVQHPDAGILYSDEDRIDAGGEQHLTAYFKPDFNYDLFLGQNMVSHLGVYRRALVEQVGGFRTDYSGSQDWDLALRVLECIRHDQVIHIPEVLYHWRAVEGSTALNHTAKAYAMTAARQAVASHLERTGQNGRVRPASRHPAYNRVEYALPDRPLTASLLVSVSGPQSGLASTLAQLQHKPGRVSINAVHTVGEHEDPTAALTQLANGTSDLVVMVTVGLGQVPDQWLDDLTRVALQTRAGCVAPRIVDASGPIVWSDHGGVLFSDRRWATLAHKGIPAHSGGYVGRNMLQQRFTALSPAVLVAQRSRLQGLMNAAPKDMGLYLGLLDWQLRLNEQGLSHLWAPELVFGLLDRTHAGAINVFAQQGLSEANIKAWFERWGEQRNDPAYNPNLSSDGDFSLNWAERRQHPA